MPSDMANAGAGSPDLSTPLIPETGVTDSGTASGEIAGPVSGSERIVAIDVLRGFALLGVLIANLVWFAFAETSATDEQREAWITNNADDLALAFTSLFVADKANTLFAVLFGIGFWMQMGRLKYRDGDFGKVYLRRLTILLLFGIAHMFLLWPWDILHMYALIGFALFALRGLPMRWMLIVGAALAVLGMPLAEYASEATGLKEAAEAVIFSEAAIEQRQQVFAGDSYARWLGESLRLFQYDYIMSGLFFSWWLYVLGRFLVGAWIARKGWLEHAPRLLPSIRRVFIVALPLGLSLEAVWVAIEYEFLEALSPVADLLHAVGVPILALGYAAGLILLFHSKRWSGIARIFAPVGQMALTNYVLQSFLIAFLLFGYGPGLGLAGQAAPANNLAVAIAFFSGQVIFSHLWLRTFRFGPLEWAWRALTYGNLPTFRKAPAG